jgi:hypothetical protein
MEEFLTAMRANIVDLEISAEYSAFAAGGATAA